MSKTFESTVRYSKRLFLGVLRKVMKNCEQLPKKDSKMDYLFVSFMGLFEQKRTKNGPPTKAAKWVPKGTPRAPQGSPKKPKGGPREPKGRQMDQTGAQMAPRGPKGAPREPIASTRFQKAFNYLHPPASLGCGGVAKRLQLMTLGSLWGLIFDQFLMFFLNPQNIDFE